MTTTEQMHCKQ